MTVEVPAGYGSCFAPQRLRELLSEMLEAEEWFLGPFGTEGAIIIEKKAAA